MSLDREVTHKYQVQPILNIVILTIGIYIFNPPNDATILRVEKCYPCCIEATHHLARHSAQWAHSLAREPICRTRDVVGKQSTGSASFPPADNISGKQTGLSLSHVLNQMGLLHGFEESWNNWGYPISSVVNCLSISLESRNRKRNTYLSYPHISISPTQFEGGSD